MDYYSEKHEMLSIGEDSNQITVALAYLRNSQKVKDILAVV